MNTSDVQRTRLIGRERELNELSSLLSSVLSGKGELALISGEPGIGKTSLADAVAEEAISRDFRVASGRCWEVSGGPVFWPWIQILRSLIDEAESSGSQLNSEISFIRRFIPELKPTSDSAPHSAESKVFALTPEVEPEVLRFRLFEAIVKFCKDVSRTTPWLLILDDCHAADEPSLRLLEFFAKQIRQTRILQIVTYRDADIRNRTWAYEIVSGLSREGHRYALQNLVENDVRVFLEGRSPRIKEAGLVRKLFLTTEGNPFFLNEIVNLIGVKHPGEEPDDLHERPFEVPEQVGAAIRLRCGLVSQTTRRMMDVAATIGVEFDLRLLARVIETDVQAVSADFAQARSLDLVRADQLHPTRYKFVHALFAETLYDDLSAAVRQDFHGRIARVLKVEQRRPSEIADHLLKALPNGDVVEAMEYAKRAAQHATDALAYEDAANVYQLAIRATENYGSPYSVEYCELVLNLAEARTRSGDFQAAIENFEKATHVARNFPDTRYFARAVFGLGSLPETPGVTNRKLIGQLEDALELLGTADEAWRARLLGRLAEALQWSDPGNRRTALAKEAVNLARRVGDAVTLADVLYRMYVAILSPDTAEERLATSTEILALTPQCQNPRVGLRAGYMRIRDLLELDQIEDLDREIHVYSQMCADLRQQHLGYTEAALAMRATMDGRFDEAERLAVEALNLGQSRRDTMAAQAYATQISLIRREQDRLSEMEPIIKSFVVQFPELVFARCAVAFCYSELTRLDDARFHFEYLAQDDFSRLRRDATWLAAMALLSETCVFLKDITRAEILYGQLLPFSRRQASLDIYVSYGPVALQLGALANLLRKFDEAEKHFELAMTMSARAGTGPWHAYAKLHYAEMLVNRNRPEDREKATSLLESAIAIARSLTMPALEKKANTLKSVLAPHQSTKGFGRLLNEHGRVLATIMFLDIVDSTVHAAQVGDSDWKRTLDSYYYLIRRQLNEFNGFEVNTFGDDFFALFERPAAAVRCASAISSLVKELGIEVRIGIHTGECELEQGRVSGIAVHIGARVVRRARSGEVVVSSTVKDVVSGAGFEFNDLGACELKGLPGQWSLFALRSAPSGGAV